MVSILSEWFGRTGTSSAPEKFPALPAGKKAGLADAEPVDEASVSAIGGSIGEENETLRTRLLEAGRKIEELDQLKEMFGNIADTVGKALCDLEQENSRNLGLRNILAETRTAYEKLRTEFYVTEKKAVAAESDNEHLRDQLELAQQSARGLESTKVELSNEVAAKRTQIANLERQLAAETAQCQAHAEDGRALAAQIGATDKKIIQLEAAGEAAREKLVLAEEARRSLQNSLDHAVGEIARLSRRLTESENVLAAARSRLGQLEAETSKLTSERNRLAGQLEEANERHHTEVNTLTTQVDSLQSRAATAEKLLADARENLVARAEEVREFDRKAVEATIALHAAEKKLRGMDTAHADQERQIGDLTQSRAALVERSNALANNLKSREAALARAEEKIQTFTARVGELESEQQSGRAGDEKRLQEVSSALNRERMERAVAEGALKASRKDFARVQRELMALSAANRRNIAPLAVNPAAAAPAGNADPNGKDGKPQVPTVEPIVKN